MGKSYKEILVDPESTLFTHIENGEVKLRKNRPGLLVSSTSWTEDEDFSVLFAALQGMIILLVSLKSCLKSLFDRDLFLDYEEQHTNGNKRKLPDLYCFITGKGHLKEYYCRKIAEQSWKHIKVYTPWLSSNQYPLILGKAACLLVK